MKNRIEITPPGVGKSLISPSTNLNVGNMNRTTQAVSDFITCNAEIMSGTPVFKNTRVPIKNLIDYLEAGDSLGRIFGRFPVCQPYPSCSGIRTREGDATHTSLRCYFKMFGELYA